ncbi:MAG: acyclic terpene utilization AtuA family protein [Moorellaceae bacterium]
MIRIGAGAGYGGDRFEPAVELVEKGDIDYLVYECMAERTIALYQQDKLRDPSLGYNPQIERRLAPVIRKCKQKGIKIITNMGAANPEGALIKVEALARSMQVSGLKIAAVIGDNILDQLEEFRNNRVLETGLPVAEYLPHVVSANAYLGVEPIVQALSTGADIVITGRVADPSLFLGPMIYEFGWALDDWDRLGMGTVVGHLLECAGQVTGGYFADPGYKDVPRLWELGFPIAEVNCDGSAVITKPEGSGGIVSTATCKEQLLYEIHDPASYITPDCIADFSQVTFEQLGPDRVAVRGGRGRQKTEWLKVSIGYRDSFVGEGQISYGGAGAVERARLAGEIVRKRLELRGVRLDELRLELIGVDSLHGSWISSKEAEPYEVRLRVVGRSQYRADAEAVGEEVETLWTNGPAGGGGATKAVREVIAIVSTFIPRSCITPKVITEVV